MKTMDARINRGLDLAKPPGQTVPPADAEADMNNELVSALLEASRKAFGESHSITDIQRHFKEYATVIGCDIVFVNACPLCVPKLLLHPTTNISDVAIPFDVMMVGGKPHPPHPDVYLVPNYEEINYKVRTMAKYAREVHACSRDLDWSAKSELLERKASPLSEKNLSLDDLSVQPEDVQEDCFTQNFRYGEFKIHESTYSAVTNKLESIGYNAKVLGWKIDRDGGELTFRTYYKMQTQNWNIGFEVFLVTPPN